jgi:hypothetical protein
VPLLAVVFANACGVEPGCDICTTSVTVIGKVVSTQGPLVGARVRGLPFASACELSIQAGDSSAVVTTSATGAFTFRVSTMLTSGPHCVAFQITPAQPSAWRDTTLAVPGIHFGSDYPSLSSATATVHLQVATP